MDDETAEESVAFVPRNSNNNHHNDADDKLKTVRKYPNNNLVLFGLNRKQIAIFAASTFLMGTMFGCYLDRKVFSDSKIRSDLVSDGPQNLNVDGGGGEKTAKNNPSPAQHHDEDEEDDNDEDNDDANKKSVKGSAKNNEDSAKTVKNKDGIPDPLPPLSDLINIQTNEIVSDVSWMLDYAIIGFPKCGTSYLMYYLERINETYINPGEICSMDFNRPYEVVKEYYNRPRYNVKKKTIIRFGLKCPRELETEYALPNYVEHFPQTRFVVTTRHPVWWFQSFYNFRAYKNYPNILPRPNEMIGACQEGYDYLPKTCIGDCKKNVTGNFNICTDRARFHVSLSRLGKTPMSTQKEMELLDHHKQSVLPTKSKVFLMEINQLDSNTPELSEGFVSDMGAFLKFDNADRMPPLKPYNGMPNRYSNADAKAMQVDICDEEHDVVRAVLVDHGKKASVWIRDFFLESPDVHVSKKKVFLELIDKWGVDPCEGLKKESKGGDEGHKVDEKKTNKGKKAKKAKKNQDQDNNREE